MIFLEEVARRLENANARGRSATEAFFKRFEIDRQGLEALVFRNVRGTVTHYYVSTVPRGLGGSTSDVDLILVTSNENARETTVSTMLFYGGRRIGAKVLTRADVAASLEAVRAGIASWQEDRRYPIAKFPVKWVDLERLVNGTRFDGQPEYAADLPALCQWSVIASFGLLEDRIFMAAVANIAHQSMSARAYGEDAIACAMDCVMASCGHIQANAKWTFERWRRFVEDAPPPAVLPMIEVVNSARRAVETRQLGFLQDLALVRDRLQLDILSGVSLRKARVRPSSVAAIHQFLPAALTLQVTGRVAVVPSQVFEQIDGLGLDGVVGLDPAAARATLALLQTGFLVLKFEGAEHG
jgi:hypothetical protein